VFQRYRDIQERRHSFEGAESGFTLIELLIVIVVLGILAAIVVFSLTGVTGQSKAAACTTDGKTIEVAADAYQAYYGSYPTDSTVLNGSYLQTWPIQNGYTFGIDSTNATVDVTVATNPSTVYTDPTDGCAALG
jgi:prepilin-type N-terminal cleavage/methylation domain-containing protein